MSSAMLKPKTNKIQVKFLFPSFSLAGTVPSVAAAPLVVARRASNLRVWATLRMLPSTST